MTVTLELEPELEQGLLTQARERGVSVDTYLQEIVSKQVRVAAMPAPVSNIELPIRHLGAVASLHRRDIYDDARDNRPITEIIGEIMEGVSTEDLDALPKDGASQIDHYVYGLPKRDQ